MGGGCKSVPLSDTGAEELSRSGLEVGSQGVSAGHKLLQSEAGGAGLRPVAECGFGWQRTEEYVLAERPAGSRGREGAGCAVCLPKTVPLGTQGGLEGRRGMRSAGLRGPTVGSRNRRWLAGHLGRVLSPCARLAVGNWRRSRQICLGHMGAVGSGLI